MLLQNQNIKIILKKLFKQVFFKKKITCQILKTKCDLSSPLFLQGMNNN